MHFLIYAPHGTTLSQLVVLITKLLIK